MTAKFLMWITIGLAALVLTLVVILKVMAARVDALKAEKAAIQQELDLTKADLKVSVDNHNLMFSEKNRQMALERERADAERTDAVAYAKIQKDIEYAGLEAAQKPEGDVEGQALKACIRSAPVRSALRGLYQLENPAAARAVDRVQDAGRSGKAVGVPGAAARNQP